MVEDTHKELMSVQHELDTLRSDFAKFAYIISHDMAAPFRQIEGFADIIRSNNVENFDEKTKKHFEFISNGSKSGSRMINALQNYSQLIAKPRELSIIDCNAVVDGVLEQLEPLIQDTDAKITCKKLPTVKADRQQLEQHYFHLLQNALQYKESGGSPVIELDYTEREGYFEFSISDNGIGVPEKQVDKIFLVFRRAVSNKDYAGLGMGLAVCKQIIQNHGGTIWVVEREGKGSIFYFTLPNKVYFS